MGSMWTQTHWYGYDGYPKFIHHARLSGSRRVYDAGQSCIRRSVSVEEIGDGLKKDKLSIASKGVTPRAFGGCRDDE